MNILNDILDQLKDISLLLIYIIHLLEKEAPTQ